MGTYYRILTWFAPGNFNLGDRCNYSYMKDGYVGRRLAKGFRMLVSGDLSSAAVMASCNAIGMSITRTFADRKEYANQMCRMSGSGSLRRQYREEDWRRTRFTWSRKETCGTRMYQLRKQTPAAWMAFGDEAIFTEATWVSFGAR